MARRKKKKADYSIRLIFGAILILMIAAMAQDATGRWMLGGLLIVLPAFWIFFKVYPPILRAQRLRGLKLDDVDNMPGHQFEHYVAALMRHRGFDTSVTKGSGDLGVDIVAEKAGVKYAVQCKRYSDNLSRTAVSDAVAGMQHYGCSRSMVVTNRYFTQGALELAKSTQCILVDRNTLVDWINEFQTSRGRSQVGGSR